MLNNGITELQYEDECIKPIHSDCDDVAESMTLFEEEIVELEQERTRGIRSSYASCLNRLLTDSSRIGNFSSFFKEILSLLKSGKKRKIASDCQFVIFQDQKKHYSIVSSVKSISLKHKLKQSLHGYLYICDLGSLPLIFNDSSSEREALIQLVFSSTFSRKSTQISKFEVKDFNCRDLYCKGINLKVESLYYALENEDCKAVKVICNVFKRFKERDGVLKEATINGLLEVIKQQNNTSYALLGCVNYLLESRIDNINFYSESDASLVKKLNIFAHTICNSDMLLKRVCSSLYVNIVKAICLVDLEGVKKIKSDYFRSDSLGTGHTTTSNMIVDMSYGPDNDNIIFLLMQSDSLKLLKLLFRKYRLDVDQTNSYGYSVLHFAAIYNAKRCTEFLLNSQIKIKQKPAKSGLIPLHLAAGSDSFEVLKLLVQHNPFDIYVKDNIGRNILHHAALGGYVANVRYCVESLNMDVNQQATVLNSEGEVDELLNAGRNCTPLHFAIEEGNLDVVDYLINCCSVDLFAENSEGYTPVTSVDCKGNTLLHQCVVRDNVKLLTSVLLMGWEEVICTRNCDGKTPFDLAISSGKVICAWELLYYYLNIVPDYRDCLGNSVFECRDNDGNTLLHQSISMCNVNFVKRILSYNDVNLMSLNKSQETPLDVAIRMRNVEIIVVLLTDKRQKLIAKDGSSYTVKLMSNNLMTKEICGIIKNRRLKRERTLCGKLYIFLILSFAIITSVIVVCIIKFHDRINSIFSIICSQLYVQTFLIITSVFTLTSIFVSCCLFGKLYIKFVEQKKVLPMEVNNTDFNSSKVCSQSVNNECVYTPVSKKKPSRVLDYESEELPSSNSSVSSSYNSPMCSPDFNYKSSREKKDLETHVVSVETYNVPRKRTNRLARSITLASLR